MRYRYEEEIKTCEELLKAIGREDIPSSKVSIERGIDPETGRKFIEIIIPDIHPLLPVQAAQIAELAKRMGYGRQAEIKPLELEK